MFSLDNVCVVKAINNGSTLESRTRVKETFGSATNNILKYYLTTTPRPCLFKELLPLQHSLAGTYHAAAGHTLFLSLRSLEFSTLDQFRWTSAHAPPFLLLAHLPAVCLDDTANQKKKNLFRVEGSGSEEGGRGTINNAFDIQLKGHWKERRFELRCQRQRDDDAGHKRKLPI